MLPLPAFEWLAPLSVDEAVGALGRYPGETVVLAGGTDLLPNLKHGLLAPRLVVGLGRVAELAQLTEAGDGSLWIGAGVTLARLASERRIQARYPALAEAAGSVASPQVRQMATLGGNLCLDTRCHYYNQSAFWRGALGYCLKKDGDTCHVVPQGKRCVAAFSADTPGALLAYQATVELTSVRGTRAMPLARFYSGDGVRNTVRADDELVTGVRIPAPTPGLRSGYQKVRARRAIDFPLLSVAIAAEVDPQERIQRVRVVVAALGALPRLVHGLEGVSGQPLGSEVFAMIASQALASCHPLANLADPGWRQAIIGTVVRRTLESMQPSAPDGHVGPPGVSPEEP